MSSVIALGLCAAIFVASNSEDSDSISNVLSPSMRVALAQAGVARTSKLVLGASQEDDDMKAIDTAWATFQDSENASVRPALASASPANPSARALRNSHVSAGPCVARVHTRGHGADLSTFSVLDMLWRL